MFPSVERFSLMLKIIKTIKELAMPILMQMAMSEGPTFDNNLHFQDTVIELVWFFLRKYNYVHFCL